MCPRQEDEKSNAARSWWFLLWILLTAGISGFFLTMPFDRGEANMYYVILTGIFNIFMVCAVGLAFWRFYTTVREERFVVTRKYVIVVLIVLVIKYIYLRSIQETSLNKCAPNIREECRQIMEADGYSALGIILGDLFIFVAIGAIGVFLIQYVLEPMDREGFTAWMSRFIEPKDNEDKLNDVETKLKDNKTMDKDTITTEKV